MSGENGTMSHISVFFFLKASLPVFGECDKLELDALQIMQNKAARLVINAGRRTSRTELFAQTGWLTVRQLIFYQTALSTYRI